MQMKTITEPTTENFETDHIYLAGFLTCNGHEVIEMSKKGTRVAFGFDRTPELLADVAAFMSGDVVPARQFSFELLELKRMLHGGQSKMKKVNTSGDQHQFGFDR
jgi:hypothetical protein